MKMKALENDDGVHVHGQVYLCWNGKMGLVLISTLNDFVANETMFI